MKHRIFTALLLAMTALPLTDINAADKKPLLMSESKEIKMEPAAAMQKTFKFLKEAHVYYIATVEGDQPRVRPFGTVLIYKGRLYIQTGKHKFVSKQIAANPKVELCAFKDGEWIRVAGTLVDDPDREAKAAMLEAYPSLKSMYDADDPNTQVLYFKNAVVTFYGFGKTPESTKF